MIESFTFFFQAEDGIRDLYVTGVQTCALPILHGNQLFKPLARTQLFHLGIGRLSRAFLGAFRLLFRVCGHRFIGCSPCESNVPLYGATARFTRRSGDLRWPAMLN